MLSLKQTLLCIIIISGILKSTVGAAIACDQRKSPSLPPACRSSAILLIMSVTLVPNVWTNEDLVASTGPR